MMQSIQSTPRVLLRRSKSITYVFHGKNNFILRGLLNNIGESAFCTVEIYLLVTSRNQISWRRNWLSGCRFCPSFAHHSSPLYNSSASQNPGHRC